MTYVHVRIGAETVVASVPPHVQLVPNQPIWLAFDQEKLHLFDAATGQHAGGVLGRGPRTSRRAGPALGDPACAGAAPERENHA